MRIYTRAGDDGSTGVLGAGRLSKADPRIEAYGSVDELNAVIGAARAMDTGAWLAEDLEVIQRALFQVGGELAATSAGALGALVRVSDDDVGAVEQMIDRFESDLPPLTSFLVPGGTPLAAELHVARTVCRRAERRVVALAQQGPVEPRLVRFLNRVGDLLFVMARWSNRRAGVGDREWHQREP